MSLNMSKQFVIIVLKCNKSLFCYTIFTISVFPVVCDIDFIVITEISCARSTTFPSLNLEHRYTEDRYTGVLPHTFYYTFCWAKEC